MRFEMKTMICDECGKPCHELYDPDKQDIVTNCCKSSYLYKPRAEYIRDDIIKKIEQNDYNTLGKLADLIMMQEDAPKIKTVTCTTATLNKMIRDKVKK